MPLCSGSKLMCSMGTAPSDLMVATPDNPMKPQQTWPANIMDCKPMVNIRPFGMCRSMANPQVMAASAAARGATVPAPCIPNVATWAPGDALNMVRNLPGLTKTSQAVCAFGGVIIVTVPNPIM